MRWVPVVRLTSTCALLALCALAEPWYVTVVLVLCTLHLEVLGNDLAKMHARHARAQHDLLKALEEELSRIAERSRERGDGSQKPGSA